MNPVEIVINEYKKSGESLREFSKKFDISPSSLSKILTGKRGIPKSQAKKFAQKIFSDISSRETFVEAVLDYKAQERPIKKIGHLVLNQNQSSDIFSMLSEWEYFAVLNVIKLKNFDHTPLFLANTLNIPIRRVNHCLDVLLKNKFISNKNGQIKRLAKNINTTDDVLSRALKMAHLEELEIAKSKIDVDVEKKDYQSMTFTLARKDIPKIKKIIDRTITEIEKFTDNSEPEEVYLLSTQLLPISNAEFVLNSKKKRGLKKHEH